MRVGFAAFIACLLLQVVVAGLNFLFGWSINLLSLGDDALSLIGAGFGILLGLPLFGWAFGGVYRALHADEGETIESLNNNED